MKRNKWDVIGIGASVACAIHCVLLPLVFTTLTLSGIEFIENKYLEVLTILVSLTAGSWALLRGHQKRWLVACFIAGVLLMVTGNFWHTGEILCKLAGSGLIIYAHVKNIRCHIIHK